MKSVQENRVPNPVRDFHPHTLRHTFATRCFENKMESDTINFSMALEKLIVSDRI